MCLVVGGSISKATHVDWYSTVSEMDKPTSCNDTRLPLSRFDSQGDRVCWSSAKEKEDSEGKLELLSTSYKSIIQAVGEDPNREELLKTPLRAAKALCFFTKGYEESIQSEFILHQLS